VISPIAAITAAVIFMLSVCAKGNGEEITKECTPETKTLHIGMTAWELEHCWPPFSQYVKISEKQGAQGTVTVYEAGKAQAPTDGVNKIFVVNGRVFFWGRVREPNPNAERDFQRRLRQRYSQWPS